MKKLLILQNNLVLISIIKESDYTELGEPDCILVNPFIVKEVSITSSYSIEPWLSNYTKQKEFKIHSDKILTIAEPDAKLGELYDEMTK